MTKLNEHHFILLFKFSQLCLSRFSKARLHGHICSDWFRPLVRHSMRIMQEDQLVQKSHEVNIETITFEVAFAHHIP